MADPGYWGCSYLLCVLVALWQVGVAGRPAGRMERRTGAGAERGCVHGYPLHAGVFSVGSCASEVAPGLRLHPCGTARWRRRPMCGVYTAVEAGVLPSPLLAVCSKMEAAASQSWEGWGLCLASVGGAFLCPD